MTLGRSRVSYPNQTSDQLCLYQLRRSGWLERPHQSKQELRTHQADPDKATQRSDLMDRRKRFKAVVPRRFYVWGKPRRLGISGCAEPSEFFRSGMVGQPGYVSPEQQHLQFAEGHAINRKWLDAATIAYSSSTDPSKYSSSPSPAQCPRDLYFVAKGYATTSNP